MSLSFVYCPYTYMSYFIRWVFLLSTALHLYVLFYTVSLSVVCCPYTYMSYFMRWVCLLSTTPTPICPILYGELVCCQLLLHLFVLFYTVSLSAVNCLNTYMSYFMRWVCLLSTASTPICPILYREFVCYQLLLYLYVMGREGSGQKVPLAILSKEVFSQNF